MNQPPEESQLGVHLPDEPSYFPISLRWEGCPWCGQPIQINRLRPFAYEVICSRIKCDFKTSTHRFSEDAVKEFRVTALLNRP